MDRLIGVLGGTFDPPHLGHMILADEGRAALGIERILWVVTADPPHRPTKPIAPIADRLNMVQAAVAADPNFELSLADVERVGPHYSVGTLAWLSERNPGARFAYLMGSDSLQDLPLWHTPQRFVEACSVLGVMRRPGAALDMTELEEKLPGIGAKLAFFEAPLVGISAQDIRRRVRSGAPFRYLVHPRVADIIQSRGLYR